MTRSITKDRKTIRRVVKEYLHNPDKPTHHEVAAIVGIGVKPTRIILRTHIGLERRRKEALLRQRRRPTATKSKSKIIKRVIAEYCENPDKPTQVQVAAIVGIGAGTVGWILRTYLDPMRGRAEAKLRYSRSKMIANPMRGKNGERHHNWKGGRCTTEHGYVLVKTRFGWIPEHQWVFMKLFKWEKWPRGFEVHHIDKDPGNNNLDNLALVTTSGHSKIHGLMKGPYSQASKRLRLWEHWLSMTSRSPKIKATLPKA